MRSERNIPVSDEVQQCRFVVGWLDGVLRGQDQKLGERKNSECRC